MKKDQVCDICGDPITAFKVSTNKSSPLNICQNVFCQRLHEQSKTMHPNAYKAHFDFQRKRILDHREKERIKDHHKRTIIQQQTEENQSILEQYQDKFEDDQKVLRIVSLPKGLEKIIPQQPERIKKYLDHVRKCVEEARRYKNESDIPQDQHLSSMEHATKIGSELQQNPALRQLSDQLCTLCKGGCCPVGADHGFVSSVTIWRTLKHSSDLTDEEILTRYEQHIPQESVEGACINQTATGCSLPREYRSDVCNGYYCDEVRKLQLEANETHVVPSLLVIQRDHTNWNRFEVGVESKVVWVGILN